MSEFSAILAEGKPNSLGRAEEVLSRVLKDRKLLPELYQAIYDSNEWVRLRAADVFEKVCRAHPEWIQPYTKKLFSQMAKVSQPGVRWHLVQILGQINLGQADKLRAAELIKGYLADPQVDWIVANYSLEILDKFAASDAELAKQLPAILKAQAKSRHKSVAKRANKLLNKGYKL